MSASFNWIERGNIPINRGLPLFPACWPIADYQAVYIGLIGTVYAVSGRPGKVCVYVTPDIVCNILCHETEVKSFCLCEEDSNFTDIYIHNEHPIVLVGYEDRYVIYRSASWFSGWISQTNMHNTFSKVPLRIIARHIASVTSGERDVHVIMATDIYTYDRLSNFHRQKNSIFIENRKYDGFPMDVSLSTLPGRSSKNCMLFSLKNGILTCNKIEDGNHVKSHHVDGWWITTPIVILGIPFAIDHEGKIRDVRKYTKDIKKMCASEHCDRFIYSVPRNGGEEFLRTWVSIVDGQKVINVRGAPKV